MRCLGPNGKPVVIGVGSWSWSEATYKIITNGYLNVPIETGDEAFGSGPQKARLNGSYAGEGLCKSSFFKEDQLREIPERFIAIICA